MIPALPPAVAAQAQPRPSPPVHACDVAAGVNHADDLLDEHIDEVARDLAWDSFSEALAAYCRHNRLNEMMIDEHPDYGTADDYFEQHHAYYTDKARRILEQELAA